MEHFWLVWRDGGGTPTYKHLSPENASQEAQRLAIQNPGATFHVMEVKRSVSSHNVHWHDYGEFVPF